MAKVVRFLAGDRQQAGDLRARWSRALADAPPAERPLRVAVCEPLDLADFPPPPYAAVDLQWFADLPAALGAEAAEPGPAAIRLVVDEVVGRGREYLDARWAAGGERYKMLSFGRRNPALSPPEFSDRWRGHGGRLGGTAIPDEVRGLAYVQDHPVPLDGHPWPLDAVNEVTFESLDDLRRRRDWFAATGREGRAGDLMSPTETWSMYVVERPVSPSRRGPTPPAARP